MKYYSKATGGFYSKDVHGPVDKMPADVVEVKEEEWLRLLAEQEKGKVIVGGTDGCPVAVDYKPSAEEAAAQLRRKRNTALADSDGLVARHRDELERSRWSNLLTQKTTLTPEQYDQLQAWRRALRDLPSTPAFPFMELPERPV